MKNGEPNHILMQDPVKYGVSNLLGEAKLKGIYPMVVASKRRVPMLLNKEGEGKVSKSMSFQHNYFVWH